MPADTATDSLGLLLMGTGNDDSSWGTLLNAQVIQYLEDAVVGQTAVSTTGGATTLTQAQCRPRTILVTGTLTSDATLTVPTKKNDWIITNNCTGAFGVLFKTAAGVTIGVPAGTSKEVFCDGANLFRVDRDKVGDFFYTTLSFAPFGSWECDGSVKSKASYPDIAAGIATGWGSTSTTFTLPDAKTAGKFLRSRSGTVVETTAQSDQNQAHAHSGSTSGTTLSGTLTSSSSGSHTHTATVTDSGHVHGTGAHYDIQTVTHTTNDQQVLKQGVSGLGNTDSATTGITVANSTDGPHTHTVDISGGTATTTLSIASDGGTEARPTNLSAILCVRY